MESPGCGIGLPDFEAWLGCLLDTYSLANHVASLSLGFLLCTVGIQAVCKGQMPLLDVKVGDFKHKGRPQLLGRSTARPKMSG